MDNYKYKTGDIVNDNIILDKTTIKKKKRGKDSFIRGYYCECLFDGYKRNISEYELFYGHHCCEVCRGLKIIKGINDITTTAPEIVKYFENEKDLYNYTRFSSKKLNFICPYCKTNKKMAIRDLSIQGFSCPKCNDGISKSSKFIYSILSNLNVNFETEYTADWCIFLSFDGTYIYHGRYDFYFEYNNKKYVIEVDGNIGHGNDMKNKMYKSAEETKYIDDMKDKIAIDNECIPIRIDCKYNNASNSFEYIKNSILNSKLNTLFDLEKLDLKSIFYNSFEVSLLIKSIELFNSGLPIKDISKKLSISDTTVRSYLHKGNNLNLCNYKTQRRYTYYVSKINDSNILIFKNRSMVIDYLNRDDNNMTIDKFKYKIKNGSFTYNNYVIDRKIS